ncbi:MAG: hypothetical protein QOE09_1330 [Ilumatobacteraceae bacterium]
MSSDQLVVHASDWAMHDWERRLCSEPTLGVFSPADVDWLPEPVQRYFKAAIAIGTPLYTSARFRMHGHIKVGRWLPFRARQVLRPHVGFIWSARAAGVIAGYDRFVAGAGEMNWKIAGLFNVAHGDGPDISKSSAGRCGLEAILLPTAMLPRFGLTWTAEGNEHITGHSHIGATPIDVQLTIDAAGLVRSVSLQRWGDVDETGTWDWHAFGGEITGHRSFAGLTIPSAGRLGWNVGTDRWASGEFFRYEITSLQVPALHGGFD